MRSNVVKLVSIACIVVLGIAFVAGLGTLSPTIKSSLAAYLNENEAPDLIVKSKSSSGFSASEINEFKRADGVETVCAIGIIDLAQVGLKVEEKNARIYVLDSFDLPLGKIKLNSGRLPSGESGIEMVVERNSNSISTSPSEINFFGYNAKIVGTVANSLIFERTGELDTKNKEPLEFIGYVLRDSLPTEIGNMVPKTDLYLSLKLNSGYFAKNYINEVKAKQKELAKIGDYAFLTLEENKSYAMLVGYCDKVDVITFIFPVFFILVVGLVVLTTMTRMIEEERSMLGCLKTLGFSDGAVAYKYIFIVGFITVIASAVGLLIGLYLLPYVIYPAFNTLFFMPPQSSYLSPLYGLVAALFMLIASVSVTTGVAYSSIKGAPSNLLMAKAPRVGKKIFLERLKLWGKLPFRYKSTLRNIFRYKKHLIMTVVSVGGSTALTFAGFALLSIAETRDSGSFETMKQALGSIAWVIIAFALLLCLFVVYNLTNMNIGERKRELATLKILGYHDLEVISYIYREIFIMALMGIAVGLPVGCCLIQGILSYLNFGSLADVRWFYYFVTAFSVLLFVGIVDLLLKKKITDIDMRL